MSTRIVFSRLPKSDFLASFAEKRIEAVMSKFQKRGQPIDATVRLSMLNAPGQPGADTFACEVRLRRRGVTVVLREAGANLYSAISEASDRLLTVLARRKERRTKRRHQQPLRELLQAS